jgi:peptide/nickel transport system ATP-binding protein
MTALNPAWTIGSQLIEVHRRHKQSSYQEDRARAIGLLAKVGIARAAERLDAYPHQLSGGMRQRVMIAIALACGPQLLVADEPTTALDVTVQAEIIDLMQELAAAKGTAILMISHDLGLVAKMCRRVAVMYAGRIVEERAAADVFANPRHPYTQGLVASLPRLGSRAAHGRQRLREIAGVVPSIAAYPAGCRFNPRCIDAIERCRYEAPAATQVAGGGIVRCHVHG